MKINKIRSILYGSAKYLGDYKAFKSRKVKQRIGIRVIGFYTGKITFSIFRYIRKKLK